MKGAILLRTIVINDEVILKEQDYVAKFHKRCGYFRCILDPKCGPPMVQWLTVAAADAVLSGHATILFVRYSTMSLK